MSRAVRVFSLAKFILRIHRGAAAATCSTPRLGGDNARAGYGDEVIDIFDHRRWVMLGTRVCVCVCVYVCVCARCLTLGSIYADTMI